MAYLLRYSIFAGLLLSRLGLAAPVSSTSSIPASASVAPHESGGEEHIVIVDKHAPIPPRVAEVLARLDLDEEHPDVRHVFNNSAFQGFAASMKSHCLDLLANMSDISKVEKAVTVSMTDALTYDTRPDAPWGLQRISTASSVAGSAKAMDYTYSFANANLGAGSDVYIIDTGVYTEHNVFGGRAKMLWSFDGNLVDHDGHGTHVAGTAAGAILGVASNANLYGIKALDANGGGWSSNVVAGIDYVLQRHDARKAGGDTSFAGSVMSMSLATDDPVSAINDAVEAAVEAGVHTCVAAGNANTDACGSSPASAGGTRGRAITVGAVDMNAQRATFSNYGPCVDLYGPGVDVVSSWIGRPNMVNVLSGTSMATPHVTGIVAYAMANQTLAADPGLMKEWVRMVALPVGNGILLANNGVQTGAVGGSGDPPRGLIGVKKRKDERGDGEGRSPIARAFSGLDSSMKCVRGTSGAAWLCNARRSLHHLAGVLHG